MKINNTITLAKPYYKKKNTKTNPKEKTNFKGRIFSEKNLSKFGNTAIYTSATSQIMQICSGIQEPVWSVINGLVSGLGLGAHGLSYVVKQGEKLKLNPNIVFQESENLEQAANFAKQNFKIDYFNIDNIDTANWINKGLTKLSNAFKGHTYMAKRIELVDFPSELIVPDKITGAQYIFASDTVRFNKSVYKDIDKIINRTIDATPSDLLFTPLSSKRDDKLTEMIIKYKTNSNSLSFAQKTSLFAALRRKLEVFAEIGKKEEITNNILKQLKNSKTKVTDPFSCTSYNEYDYLFHEYGHMFDFKEQSLYQGIKARRQNPKIFEKEKQNIILPELAQSSFLEFNAEIFSGKMNGDKYIEPIENLLKKMNNIKMPD